MPTTGKAIFEGTIQPWGNSLGIRITRPMSEIAHLTRGDKVAIEVTAEGLFIRPAEPKRGLRLPFSEADLVAGLTALASHADELPVLMEAELGD